jgi:hypothetical protein
MTPKELMEIEDRIEAAGWRWVPDAAKGFTAGYWRHDELGFCSNQGGSYSTAAEATEAVERFLGAWQQM